MNRALRALATGFGIFEDMAGDAFDQCMLDAFLDQPLAPGQVFFLGLSAFTLEALGDFEQPVGAVGPAVQHNILDQFFQLGLNLVINNQLSGVYNPHIEAGFDGVVQEDRMNGFSHRIVAAERKRYVTHTPGN